MKDLAKHEPSVNKVIRISHWITEARYDFTVLEMRLFLMVLGLIEKGDTADKVYAVSIQKLMDLSGTNSPNDYNRAKDAVRSLKMFIHDVEDPETGKLVFVAIFKEVAYIPKQGLVEVQIDPRIMPHLQNQESLFTLINTLDFVMKFKSHYSQRLYLLLAQFRRRGWRIMKVDSLRFMLMLDGKYHQYSQFKEAVIKKAQEELANSDIPFDFKERKCGKKVVSVAFTIRRIDRDRLSAPVPKLNPKKAAAAAQQSLDFGSAPKYLPAGQASGKARVYRDPNEGLTAQPFLTHEELRADFEKSGSDRTFEGFVHGFTVKSDRIVKATDDQGRLCLVCYA